MAIHYRRSEEGDRRPREGQVENLAELEALVTIGTLRGTDEVSLDGVVFQRIEKIPEMRASVRPGPKEGGALGNVLLIGGVGILALAALGFLFKIATIAVTLAVFGAVGLGAIWIVRKLLR